MAAAGLTGASAVQVPGSTSGPETFQVTGTLSGEGAVSGAVTIVMTLRLDQYTPERAKVTMTDALKYRGYPGFLLALREAPVIGSLDIADQKFLVRWASQDVTATGRTITIVTEKPVFFFGARKPDAKSTAGYEVAVMKIEVNEAGRGDGVMAAAARVKPNGSGGVIIDQYAETPLKLSVVRQPAK
jgi:hypothetical protein